MQPNNEFRIAGPTDHPQVDAAARQARSMSLLRERVQQVARSALPPSRRRRVAADGRWPGHMPLASL